MTTLDIVPYDARWPLAFIEERDRIAVALGPIALRIEHHGSTSVVGLAAKPVIDILLRRERDGSLATHANLHGPAGMGWNEIVVDGRGNAYINGGGNHRADPEWLASGSG
jgi:GrpB-like predicted nucleotidyltransferase (UPF0157 family)